MERGPFTIDEAKAQIKSDLRGEYFRAPVIESNDELNFGNAQNQWQEFARLLLDCINQEPEIRSVIMQIGHEAVGQAMLADLLKGLSRTSLPLRVQPASILALNQLISYKPVPVGLVVPNIRYAPAYVEPEVTDDGSHLTNVQRQKLLSPTGVIDIDDLALHLMYFGTEGYIEKLTALNERVESRQGITKKEKELLVLLLQISRNIKLLTLAAMLIDEKVDIGDEPVGVQTFGLSGGANITIDTNNSDARAILDVSKWKSINSLKDRVYILDVDGKKYVLKERKTPMHLHTRTTIDKDNQPVHIDTITSEAEFTIARTIAEEGAQTYFDGELSIRPEKPVCYVEFPDGYQFCVFEFEPAVVKVIKPRHELEKSIVRSKEAYIDEFKAVKKGAKLKLKGRDKQLKDITIEDFAFVKANFLVFMAEQYVERTVNNLGYTEADGYENIFNVIPSINAKPRLEVILLDFEYYEELGEGYTKKNANNNALQNKNDAKKLYGFNWLGVNKNNAKFVAIAIAMLEKMGYEPTSSVHMLG